MAAASRLACARWISALSSRSVGPSRSVDWRLTRTKKLDWIIRNRPNRPKMVLYNSMPFLKYWHYSPLLSSPPLTLMIPVATGLALEAAKSWPDTASLRDYLPCTRTATNFFKHSIQRVDSGEKMLAFEMSMLHMSPNRNWI